MTSCHHSQHHALIWMQSKNNNSLANPSTLKVFLSSVETMIVIVCFTMFAEFGVSAKTFYKRFFGDSCEFLKTFILKSPGLKFFRVFNCWFVLMFMCTRIIRTNIWTVFISRMLFASHDHGIFCVSSQASLVGCWQLSLVQERALVLAWTAINNSGTRVHFYEEERRWVHRLCFSIWLLLVITFFVQTRLYTYQVYSVSMTRDVPYGDCFNVESIYTIKAVSADHCAGFC